MRDIRVAAVQFEHAPGNKRANLDKIRHFVAEAAAQGAEIVAFPECCVTGYWWRRRRPFCWPTVRGSSPGCRSTSFRT